MIYDMVLIGGGIMSTTLAKLLKELNPQYNIAIIEAMGSVAQESSNTWNNAGTGHAGLCELNFTPEHDGVIDMEKALHVTESFEMSRQFWSYLVEKGELNPSEFIHSVPHMSFVDHDVAFLKNRYDTMKTHHFYESMQFSDDHKQLAEWMPLVMEGRNSEQHVAATYSTCGTDLNYGSLTNQMIYKLGRIGGVHLYCSTKVTDLERVNGGWEMFCELQDGTKISINGTKVFIGAGGAAITLLEKSCIPESKGYAGFPVSGQFLVCTNPEVIAKHSAKVYGKASVGAPPMSVPHLDTRIINGEKQLLFGPFAGFSTRFLKSGSRWDLFKSIRLGNIYPMLAAGARNLGLTKYLITEVMRSFNAKVEELKRYYPEAKAEDWKLTTAGQRVQIIKANKEVGGTIEFGTEVICSADGSLSALLGASPGASTSVPIMIQVIEKCFPEMKSPEWIARMKEMIPSYGESLIENKELYQTIKKNTDKILLGK